MIARDLRYSIRTLIKQRSFTAIAVLTLAIALGANSAIFSVVNAILLRPLPYQASERLLNLTAKNRLTGDNYPVYSFPNFVDLRAQTKTLDTVVGFSRNRAFLLEGEEPELLVGLEVSHDLPKLTGIRPQVGRFINAAEDTENGARVMVISHELWKRRFNADPNIVGRAVRFGSSGESRTIIGVMPPHFRFPADEGTRDYYAPLEEGLGRARTARDQIWLNVVAKAKPGVSLEAANAELATISARIEKQYPQDNTGVVFQATSMHEDAVRDVRPALLMMFGAVAVVLLIGCANVANLLLARATARHREISIRAALGASPARITLQLLIESLVLSTLAGACGLLLAAWGIDALLAFAPAGIPRLDEVALDGSVLLFTTVLSLVTGIAFGLAPAISAARPNLTNALKEGTRGSTEGKRNRLRGALVVAAVAMSLMLLAGAGLLMRSFMHVTGVDAGYDHRNAIAIDITPRSSAYDNDDKIRGFYDQLIPALRALPGVESVAAVDALPLTPNESFWSFRVAGQPEPAPGREPSARVDAITPEFIRTMRMRVLRGRDIGPQDSKDAASVMLVNEAFVRENFPSGDALGQHILLGPHQSPTEIVGIVNDVRWRSLTAEPPSTMFFPHAQRPRRFMSVVVRSPNAASLAPTLRAVVKRIDPQQPIIGIETLLSTRSEWLAARRFALILLAVLASVALLLAAVGIFSVMSYAVTQRTSEIGIRMALGAQAADIFKLIVGGAVRLVTLGTLIGVGGALASSTAVGKFLYGVKPNDPWTFAAIVVVIAGTALLASYLPARRAARVDPLVAIRYD